VNCNVEDTLIITGVSLTFCMCDPLPAMHVELIRQGATIFGK